MLDNKEYTLNSGKTLSIAISGFGNAVQLANSLLKCLQKSGVNMSQKEFMTLDFSSIFSSPAIVQILTNTALEAFTSDSVDKIFWDMARKCTYDGLRVTEELFNNSIDARADFYQIKFLVLKENIMPFFPSLHTTLGEKQAK